MDNVGSTYYRTLLTAVTNAPQAIGRLAKKKAQRRQSKAAQCTRIGIVRSMCKTVLDYAKANNVQRG